MFGGIVFTPNVSVLNVIFGLEYSYSSGLLNTLSIYTRKWRFVSGSGLNTAQQITIASTGNSTSFGTLTLARFYGDGASNCHGGIA